MDTGRRGAPVRPPPDARLFQSDDACRSAPACSRATQGARSASAKLARSARLLFLASARLPIEKRPEASDSSSTDGEALPGNSDGRRGSSGGSRHPCEALPGQVTLLIGFTLLSHSCGCFVPLPGQAFSFFASTAGSCELCKEARSTLE